MPVTVPWFAHFMSVLPRQLLRLRRHRWGARPSSNEARDGDHGDVDGPRRVHLDRGTEPDGSWNSASSVHRDRSHDESRPSSAASPST